MSSYLFGQLRSAVVAASLANDWRHAVHEWRIADLEEDPDATGICVCGKTGLAYLYTIYNAETRRTLFPIGSHCINHFGVQHLDEEVGMLRQLFDLKAAFATGDPVTLKGGLFSRTLLKHLQENHAFPPNGYNMNNGENDYYFLLDMFNKRKNPTPKQDQKIRILISQTVRPFILQDERLK